MEIYSNEFEDKGLVKSLFDNCNRNEGLSNIIKNKGIVSIPHTNISFSGKMTANLVYHLYSLGIEKIIALGIIHGRIPSENKEDWIGGFLPSKDIINTPFGHVPLIKSDSLESKLFIRKNDFFIEKEFSLDNLFALMKFYGKENKLTDIPILPLFMKFSKNLVNDSYDVAEYVAKVLHELVDEKTAVVCTGDLMHYGHGFSSLEYMVGKPTESADLEKYFLPKIKRVIELALFKKEYDNAIAICNEIINDQQQLLPIISKYLENPDYKIFEFEFSDYSKAYEQEKPCVVASALVGYFNKNPKQENL